MLNAVPDRFYFAVPCGSVILNYSHSIVPGGLAVMS